jgi:hypothetical protein
MSITAINSSPVQQPHEPCTTYRSQTIDLSVPSFPMSPILSLSSRPGRRTRTTPIDPQPDTFFGDAIIQKHKQSIRIFFQNVKGLTYSTSGEDYRYYLSCLNAYQVDIGGLAETNTCWAHPHLRTEFQSSVRRQYNQSKVSFGSPSPEMEPCPPTESFQSGGSTTFVTGSLVSSVDGSLDVTDPSGLGRWSGISLRGRDNSILTIITAYRICSGSPRTAPLGSAFLREYEHFRNRSSGPTNPRRAFLCDLESKIQTLQEAGHMILLMLDANATTESDIHLTSFIQACNLHDLHESNPAPSTFIGSASRRIDYMLACDTLRSYVIRSGTLAYSEGPQSDHRGLYIDVRMVDVYKHNSSKLLPSVQRALHTGNPEHVTRYHESMVAYYTEHKMFERIDHLYKNHSNMSREEVRTLLTAWDNDQGRAMEFSESRLRIPPKKYRWSPQLRNSAIIRRYWKLRLREAQTTGLNYMPSFIRWQQQIQTHDSCFILPNLGERLSIEEIRQNYNRSSREFRKQQKSSIPSRMKCYYDLLEEYEDDENPETKQESQRKAKIVQRTIASETCRGTFRNIRNVVNPNETTGIAKLLVPKAPTGSNIPEDVYNFLQTTDTSDLLWETVIEKKEIERHLLEYNRTSFRAASESPCGHGIIHDAITFSSLSQASIDLLLGDVPPAWYGDDEALREFLASFAIPEKIRHDTPITSVITADDIYYGFKKWPESTSTSPSGRHLGHYKALIQHPELLSCFEKFLNIAVLRGIAISRWSKATNVLIEKDKGKPCIHRLRIIHLFEADFNFFLKLQWGHRLVRRAWELDILHPGQHGSVPQRTAMDPVMLTQLTTDLCRLLKHNLARFDNDASACYDRIIVALAMLAARRCGMPNNAIRVHAEALQFMKYTVKTVYGISDDTYQGTVFEPLFGTGQGSGASPSAWLTLVVILLHTLDRLIPDRINFTPLDNSRSHSRLVDAFVDDTSIGFNSPGDLTYNELIERLQTVAQTWEHLLHLSGGKLNLAKCSWYVMYWEWEQGRPRLRELQPLDPTIQLRQGSQPDLMTIRQTKLEESTRMLGVYLNPLGDFGHHIQVLRKKADMYASRLHSPRLTATDVHIFHRSIYVPAMRYSLSAVAADEEALQGIQNRILKTMLQKMHVNGNLPTAIRHGPIELGGMDMYDLRTEVGIEAIKYLRNALYADSEPGRLIRMNLQYSQLEAGLGSPLLEHPTLYIPYLTPTWVLSVRQFLSCHNMSISLTDTFTIPLRGATDDYIMQNTHLSRYSEAQQRDINLVRIYLQVTTLSDIADKERPSSISLQALDGTHSESWIPSSLWPRQVKPTKHQVRLWKRYLCSSYLRYIPYWKTPPISKIAEPSATTAKILPTSFSSLQEYIKTLPRTQRRLLSDLHQQATDTQVWRALRSKARLYIASDGGLDGSEGTHGWVISTKKTVLFRGSGPVDGFIATSSSTRSELAGCAASVLLLVSVSRLWGLRHRCSFRWITDSTAAISRIQRYARCHRRTTMPYDADLLSLISSLIKELRRPFTPIWVKGHQDTIESYAHLPLHARLNIDADFLATRYRHRGRLHSSNHSDHQDGQQASILINGTRLTGQYDSCIRYHINGYHLRRYMQERHGWTDQTWETIDFNLFGQHFKRLRPNYRTTHMKRVHGQLPLGRRRYQQSRIKDISLQLCPCCKLHEETSTHLLQCENNPVHYSSLAQFRKDVVTDDTHPARFLFADGIEQWCNSQSISILESQYPRHLHPLIVELLTQQESIGWEEAASGFLSKSWLSLAQCDMYDPDRRDKHEGHLRMRQMISAIYNHSTRIWKARNEVLHSKTDVQQREIRSAETAEIQDLYQKPHLLRAGDRHYCERSLERLLDGPARTRRKWLRRVRKSIEEQSKDGGIQARITSYFERKESQ